MQVQVIYFASLADVVGSRSLKIELEDPSTVANLLEHLTNLHPGIAPYESVLLSAVNQEYADLSCALSDGDEVAFFPPVSGGQDPAEDLIQESPGHYYRITSSRIDSSVIARNLLGDSDGAICIFEGVVRNNSKGKRTRYLVYEAYEPMALKKLAEIGYDLGQMWEISAVGIVHRTGRLEVGETSVALIVTSPHRRSSFDACHYAIDRLKKIVPVWKKEFFEDGEVWIEGQS